MGAATPNPRRHAATRGPERGALALRPVPGESQGPTGVSTLSRGPLKRIRSEMRSKGAVVWGCLTAGPESLHLASWSVTPLLESGQPSCIAQGCKNVTPAVQAPKAGADTTGLLSLEGVD